MVGYWGRPDGGPTFWGQAFTQQPDASSKIDPDLLECILFVGLAWPEFVSAAGTTGANRILAAGAKREQENGRLDKLAYYAERARRAKTMYDILQGHQPEGWTRAAWCKHCGAIWVDGDPAKADVDYSERCPYCSVPAPPQGFARPHVACAGCQFFTLAPGERHGTCSAYQKEVDADRKHYCSKWRHR